MEADRFYLIFPLCSAILYALAAIFLKHAGRRGIGAVRTTVVANVVTVLVFVPLYPWRQFPVWPDEGWRVFLTGGLFAFGQILTVLAFTIGQVSVATPVLGAKVFFVALLAASLAGTPLGLGTWSAVLLALVGLLMVVGMPTRESFREKGAGLGFILALGAALCFGGFDVSVQHWSAEMGFGLLVPPAIFIGTLFTMPLLFLPRPHRPSVTASAMGWLGGGAVLLALQSLILIWCIGAFGDAAGANVVYSTRGFWSVLLVGYFVRWTRDHESMDDKHVRRRRQLGALVMAASVAILIYS